MTQTTPPPAQEAEAEAGLATELLDGIKNKQFASRQSLIDFVYGHPSVHFPLACIRYTFKRPELLFNSLIHSSLAHECPGIPWNLVSNERNEFFGDAVIDLIVSFKLMKDFPELGEGDLSKFRGALVNTSSLAQLGSLLRLQDCLLVGRGELKSQGTQRESSLANTFEAFWAAIFLDGGQQACSESFDALLDAYQNDYQESFMALTRLEEFDAKSQLQEKVLAMCRRVPQYRAIRLSSRQFKVELFIDNNLIASEVNISKRKACQLLAQKTLKKLNQGELFAY